MSANLKVAALRDMGCVRTNNEDNFAYDPTHMIYVVCDGMGGAAAGEIASSIACNTVIDVYTAQPAETPVLTRLSLAIRAANDAVRQSTQQNPEQHGMGTTLVAAVVDGNKLLIGNVGDSRAYLLQDDVCMQLTVDHSYINELVRNGTVRVEDIHSVDLKGLESVITRAIGAAPVVEPDFFVLDMRHGDTLLLASDGLTRYVDNSSIGGLIDPNDLDQSCERLIGAARDGGGADNITCLLLRYFALAPSAPSPIEEPIPESVVTADPSPDVPVVDGADDSAPTPANSLDLEQVEQIPAGMADAAQFDPASPAPAEGSVVEPYPPAKEE